MSTDSTLIVTGFNARHFDLAQDMATSYRRAYQDRYPLAAIVYGPEPAPAALHALFDEVRHVAADEPAFDSSRGFYLAYSGLKTQLRDVFPGHASYCWIDADCWFQGDESMARLLAGVKGNDICIHPEFDVHYVAYPTPSERTLSIYQANEGAELDAMPMRMPMVNSGVLAMRADSPVWALWAEELRRLRKRHEGGESVFFSDQIPLHKLLYLNGLRIYPLRAVDNWQTYACLPMVHRATQSLRVPTPPHEKIGLMHLAGQSKYQTFQLDGQPASWRYRDMQPLFEQWAAAA